MIPKGGLPLKPGAGEIAFRVVDFADLPGVPCPCGTARRAFADVTAVVAEAEQVWNEVAGRLDASGAELGRVTPVAASLGDEALTSRLAAAQGTPHTRYAIFARSPRSRRTLRRTMSPNSPRA